MAVLPPFPNVIITGFDRNRVRWLRFNLDRHSEFCAPPIDTAFLADGDRMQELSRRWYVEQYLGSWNDEPFVVDATAAYIDGRFNPLGIVDRIDRMDPECRLILLIGNPLDLFEAGWRHLVRIGILDPAPNPAHFVDVKPTDPDYCSIVLNRLYFQHYQSLLVPIYLDRFGDRLLVLSHDEIDDDPDAAFASVVRHVGASPEAVDQLDLPRYGDLARYPDLVLDESDRRFLYPWFKADVDRLGERLGRDFAAWDPGTGPETLEQAAILRLLAVAGS